jgi:hypothetical protein
MAKDDVVVAAYNLNTGRGIYLTEDGGKHWSYVASEPSQYRVNAFASYDKYIVAGTGSGIYISSDNGVIWTDCTTGIGRITINSLATNGSEIFAGTAGKGIFHSSDHGKQWYNMNYGIYYTNIASLAVFNTQLYVAANTRGVLYVYLKKVFSSPSGTRSTVVLATSYQKCLPEPTVRICQERTMAFYRLKNIQSRMAICQTGINTSGVTTVEDLIVCNNTLFAAVRGKDVYMSTDDGMTWKGIGSGLITRSFMSLTESKGLCFWELSASGIWSRPLSEMIETRSTK